MKGNIGRNTLKKHKASQEFVFNRQPTKNGIWHNDCFLFETFINETNVSNVQIIDCSSPKRKDRFDRRNQNSKFFFPGDQLPSNVSCFKSWHSKWYFVNGYGSRLLVFLGVQKRGSLNSCFFPAEDLSWVSIVIISDGTHWPSSSI